MPRLVYRVDPQYPQTARVARVSGTVELEGVIGTDGRVHELRLVSGNALLVRAALDAVAQWIYEPTQLNGVTCEVTTNISVVFRLN